MLLLFIDNLHHERLFRCFSDIIPSFFQHQLCRTFACSNNLVKTNVDQNYLGVPCIVYHRGICIMLQRHIKASKFNVRNVQISQNLVELRMDEG